MKTFAHVIALSAGAAAAAPPALQDADGLQVEVWDPAAGSPEFFNRDNTIYVPGREFVFSYRIVKDGDERLCRVEKARDTATSTWSYTDATQADPLTIRYVGFRVLAGYGGLDELFPDYSQTVVQQLYWNQEMSVLLDGTTGLVENAANVWLHPFRGKCLSVTQLSPFPFFKGQTQTGDAWTWKLEIDGRWSDPRIIKFEGNLAATYEYRRVGREALITPLGNLVCDVVEGIARNRLGVARLRSFFNEQHGFVRLEYKNLDDSEVVLSLEKATGTPANRVVK